MTRKRLVVSTINLSIRAVNRNPVRLLAQLVHLMKASDVVLIQEAGSARKLVEQAARIARMHVYFGNGGVGQASTPIAVTTRAKGVSFDAHPLTEHRRYIGPGAGPDHAKGKWLMVAAFTLDGEAYAVGNYHLSPSQYRPLRALAALIQARRAARALRRYKGRHLAMGGDGNNKPGARTFRPLRRYLRSTQRRLTPVGTHGKRPIDDIYVDDTLRPVRHEAINTASDHDAYRVILTVKENP